MADRSRLGLGTVQFGMDYGVANTEGQVGEQQVAEILAYAAKAGLGVLDTAAAYGDSETVLGRYIADSSSFRIVTKTLPLRLPVIKADDVLKVERVFDASLQRLHQSRVDALLVHHAEDLLVPGGEALYAQLIGWQRSGRIQRIGVSIYDRAQIDQLLERYRFDLVQLPINVFDQRLVHDGTLEMLQQRGIEIHARSVFMQGLLLMETAHFPTYFNQLVLHHERYRNALKTAGVSPLAAALGFVANRPEVDVTLIGVNSVRHLIECIAAFDQRANPDLSSFAIDKPALVDPRCWPVR
jgi:aryl-alcohol dehydrogenase-like predicted oxidoreductase